MKKIIFLTLVFLLILPANAQQSFAPVGAKWYYGIQESFFFPEEYYRTIEAIRDTVIAQKICSVLEITDFYSPDRSRIIGYEYLYSEQQKVYRWIRTSNSFDLLYDFSLTTGESWITSNSQFLCDNTTITVNSVDTVQISGKQLKRFATSSDGGCSFGYYVTERIGGSYLFLYGYGWDDMEIPRLRCYSDNEISIQSSNCTDITFTGLSETSRDGLTLRVTDDFVSLPLLNINATADFYNINGQIVMSAKLNSDGQISIASLAKGIYFIRLYTENISVKTFKLKL